MQHTGVFGAKPSMAVPAVKPRGHIGQQTFDTLAIGATARKTLTRDS
jgi:hypothetical protein